MKTLGFLCSSVLLALLRFLTSLTQLRIPFLRELRGFNQPTQGCILTTTWSLLLTLQTWGHDYFCLSSPMFISCQKETPGRGFGAWLVFRLPKSLGRLGSEIFQYDSSKNTWSLLLSLKNWVYVLGSPFKGHES